MITSSQELSSLREAASGDPLRFAKLLRSALTADFDSTFEFLKTQKLLHKSRSSSWILAAAKDILSWLPRAPLKGKRRAQLSRHFEFCSAIQEMLDTVDRGSGSLEIWKASTDVLIEALFSAVENYRSGLEADLAKARGEARSHTGGLSDAEEERRRLRNYCDWVGRIVNQISIVGVKEVGAKTISEDEVNKALQMASLTDIILTVLDCYSYKNFPVSVRGKNVQLSGVVSKIQQALEWSTMRERSRNIVDSYKIAQNIEEAAHFAAAAAAPPQPFEDFIGKDGEGRVFSHLKTSEEQMARILRREVEELIDLDFPLRTPSGRFRTDELLRYWALLYRIASCAYIWRKACSSGGPPVLSKSGLLSLTISSLGCPREHAERLLAQFTLYPQVRNQDPFFRPLVRRSDSSYLLATSFVATGRFARNLFTIAIREGRVDFSPKGLKPLQDIGALFSKAGYDVVLNFPLRISGELITDVDIAAVKDGYLFVGQTKVLIHPDSAYDEWKILENLRRAALQLVKSIDHIQLLRDRLGASDESVEVVPFLLTNVWHYTGSAVNGFKVVDFSYLSNILTGGEIWEVETSPRLRRRIAKLIEGDHPTGEELSQLIRNPLHEEMFQTPHLSKQVIEIGEWKLTIPVEVRKDLVAKKRNQAFARRFITT